MPGALENWVHFPAVPQPSCVALDVLLNLSIPYLLNVGYSTALTHRAEDEPIKYGSPDGSVMGAI